MTSGASACARTSSVAARPSMPGMRMSIRTMSGPCSATACATSLPSAASPTSAISSAPTTIALVGLGVAIDYALLMIFRFRDELREGADAETALVETMTHAGKAVIVSGSTVAVGLLSLVVLPLPFIRSVGVGGMLIPAVSVFAAITLLPALLAVLGERINSLRLLPKRLVDHGHPEDGPWGRWGRCRLRRLGSRSPACSSTTASS